MYDFMTHIHFYFLKNFSFLSENVTMFVCPEMGNGQWKSRRQKFL